MTRPFLPTLAALAALAALALSAPAHAQRAVLTATGTLQLISDPSASLDATVTTGTLFTFTYVFDYVAPDPRDSDSTRNIYYFLNPGAGATVTFGDYVAVPGGYLSTGVVGGDPSRYGIEFQTGGENLTRSGTPVAGGVGSDIQLLEKDANTLPGNALPPPGGFTLSNFKPYSDDAYGSAVLLSGEFGPNDSGTFIKGRIDTLTVQIIPAPEPSSPVALAVGILGLGVLTMKARRRQGRA